MRHNVFRAIWLLRRHLANGCGRSHPIHWLRQPFRLAHTVPKRLYGCLCLKSEYIRCIAPTSPRRKAGCVHYPISRTVSCFVTYSFLRPTLPVHEESFHTRHPCVRCPFVVARPPRFRKHRFRRQCFPSAALSVQEVFRRGI